MPCYTETPFIYPYFNEYDRINDLFFKTPLVPLLCETVRLLEENNLTEDLPAYVRDIVIKWKEEHDKCDKSKLYLNRYSDKEKVLDEFIEFEQRLSKRK